MKKTFKYIVAMAAMMMAGQASAQNLNSAYYLDGYAYGHELNPAKEYDRKAYFSLPVLGNLNMGIGGNLHLQDVLRKNPNGSGLVTYLHPSITDLNFKDNNNLGMDLRLDILSFGFHSKHAYQTFTLGVRENMGVNIPGTMLTMVKDLENKSYNFKDLDVSVSSWLEAGWSYSRNVTKAIRVGGKFKLLFGGAYGNLKVDDLTLNLTDANRWTATANATLEAGVKGLTWGEKKVKEYSDAYRKNNSGSPATYEQIDLNNIDVKNTGLNGMGMALDLGAEWDLGKQGFVDGLKVNLAVLDMGFIKWKNVSLAQNKGEEFVFEGFDNIQVKDGTGTKFEDQTDDLVDRLSDLISLQDGGTCSKRKALGATINFGAEYALPMYKALRFGFLSTSRIQGKYSWNEERISANLSPCKWFEIAANLGVGTRGFNVGWVLNLHPRGFNIFLGSDHCIGKVSKQMIPLKSNYDFAMGINFPIGKSRINR